jgi:ferric enterobactin receptor
LNIFNSYYRANRFIHIFIFLTFQSYLFAQIYTVSGIIRDGNSNEFLPFANISITGVGKGAISNENGKFELSLKPGSYELLISYIGYKREAVPVSIINKDIILNIKLQSTDCLLQSVTVYSAAENDKASSELSSLALKSEKIGEMSAVFRDVFRSLQTMPGISTNNELSAKFNVRGGNYDENLVLVNGAQVYEPFHIKEATDVSIGIFNTDLMKKVDLMTGGFSAEFGDKMSSVLNIQYREGNRDKFKYSGSFSLASLDLLTEGPITDKGSFVIGFRKSYFEYLMGYFDIDKRIHPGLYDVQGTISFHPGSRNNLLFQFIHSGDNYYYDPLLTTQDYNYTSAFKNKKAGFYQSNIDFEEQNAKYYSNLFDIQSINFLNNEMILKAEISYYYQIDNEYSIDTTYDRTTIISDVNYFQDYYRERKYKNDLSIKTIEGKTGFDYQVNSSYELKTGISYINISYDQDLENYDIRTYINNTSKYPNITKTIIHANATDEEYRQINTNSFKYNAYFENILQLTDDFIFNLGARLDYFDINKESCFSPRISLSYKCGAGSTLRAAWGFYYQSPLYGQLKYSFSADSNTRAQKATHYILGFEQLFPFSGTRNNISFKIETFYKKYDDLISSNRSTWWKIIYSKNNDATGFAAGIDVYSVLTLDNFYGWISYGLLSTKEDILNDKIGEYPRYTDQRHTISVVADYDLGKDWSINTRLFYGSGYAYTPYTSVYNSAGKKWEWIAGDKNSAYLPFYKRVDLRFSKDFKFSDLDMFVFLDVTNLLNFSNIMSYRYTYNQDGTPKREEIKLFPIIPSIGITVKN